MKTKIKMMKRIIALLLCLCMCFSNAEGLILFAAEADTAESTSTDIDSEETEGSNSGNNFTLMAENAVMPIAEADESTMIEEEPLENSDASRVFLNWMEGRFGGVEKKNYIHVYAFAGDKICLGTNIYNAGGYALDGKRDTNINISHTDDGSIDIVIRDLNDTRIPVDIKKGEAGHIETVEKEQAAKNMTSPDGNETYKPYVYTVPESGIYTVEFRSYSGGGVADKYNKAKKDALLAPSDEPGLVSAWDITVFNENNEKKTGRVYTDFLSLQTGTKPSMKERYYIVTSDSYIYSMTFNGVKPYTYNFFANNRGLIDSANGNIVYKSVKDLENTNLFDKFGVSYTYPATKDNDLSKNFHIFFEQPNDDLKGIFYEEAILPDPAVNLEFAGDEMYAGNGGYFSFDVKEATTATLRIEFKEDYKPVEISDVVMPYATNTFFWDGRDGAGTVITNGTDIKSYSVTTKAGEIHFPIFDAEEAPQGITFTRVSKIYDREGGQLDGKGTIYDATRSVVYYDDTAIYYGERITAKGESESKVKTIQGKETPYQYVNAINNSSSHNEYYLYELYAKNHGLRMGDHSHTSNVINFGADASSQQDMINYLDSKKNPVAVSANNSNPSTVTDYAIANYWMFTAAKALTSEEPINIIKPIDGNKQYCNLVGRVFYDETVTNGKYNSKEDGDHLLKGVTVELYKKIEEDEKLQPEHSYAVVDKDQGILRTINDRSEASSQDIYELVQTGITPALGTYIFTGVEYDKSEGTTYLYHVVKPNNDYKLTSGGVSGATDTSTSANKPSYGLQYSLYSYDKTAKGTEIQILTIGGAGGVNPSSDNNTITTIDVGYGYDTTPYTLKLKKDWSPANLKGIPTSVVLEISYRFENGTTGTWDCRTLSKITSWLDNQYYMPKEINGTTVTDYFISAEYYISGDKVFRHKYDYDAEKGIYNSFVGEDTYFSISDYERDTLKKEPKTAYTMDTMPDFDGDGKIDGHDFLAIEKWEPALPAGTEPTVDQVVAPYNSVLDIDRGTAVHTITVTNAQEPGTIEVLKYTDADEGETYLDAAVFNVYEGDLETVKGKADAYASAMAAYESATDAEEKERLREEANKAYSALIAIQVDSAATRANGRFAFSGLNPEETYTVRERYAPSGYRILQEYYQINPKGKTSDGSELCFSDDNYCLVKVGNAPAEGEFELRKRITGRAWLPGIDVFTFDIKFNETDIKITPDENNLLEEDNVNKSKKDFVEAFEEDDDVTIGDSDNYAITNGVLSADTKASAPLLVDGTDSDSKASLNGKEFPAAGTYTFTVQENPIKTDDPTLTTSSRKYTVTIDVVRALDDGVEGDATKDNSHLTATISNITYQDDIETGSSESFIFSGNAPVFTNVYTVQDVDLHTKYVIEKVLTGRTDSEWESSDKFEFIIDGMDEDSQKALREGYIIIEGTEGDEFEVPDTSGDGASSERHFYLDKDNPSFEIKDISFHDVEFKATNVDENGDKLDTPITEPIIWKFIIQEVSPKEAVGGVYQGITYSTDKYLLEIELENSVDGAGEIDGVIDKITMNLYKNYKDGDSPYCSCVIVQEADEDGNEKVVSSKHGPDHSMTFTNIYKAQPTSWEPHIKKTLEGRSWEPTDSFTFQMDVTPVEGTPKDGYSISPKKDQATITYDEPHEATFGPITFTKPGIYDVTISETHAAGGGFDDISKNERTVRVQIEDNKVGILTLQFPNETSFSTSTPIEFTNQYSDTERTVPFTIKKTLEGRKWRETDTFTFKVLPDEDTQKAIEDEILVLPESMGAPDESGYYTLTVKGTDKADGNTRSNNFGDIKITSGGDSVQKYGFEITEDISGLHNTDTSDAELYLTMLVDRERNHDTNLPTGNLTVSAKYSSTGYLDEADCEVIETESEGIVIPFTNAAYVTGGFTVKKELEEREWKETDSFTVDVKVTSDNADSVMYDGKALPDSIPLTFTESKKEEKLDFRFNEAGVYTFSVKEQIPTDASAGYYNFIEYDEKEHTVTVTVEDSTTGQLEIKEIQVDDTPAPDIESAVAMVTNRYIPTPVKYTPQVKKEFIGDPIPTVNWKTFEFTISADAGNPAAATLPAKQTTTVIGEGTAEFGEITFEKAGTYNFTIAEKKGSDSGYEYDNSVWTLTVEVKDNDGVLEVSSNKYRKKATTGEDTDESDENAIFTNRYAVTPVSFTPKAEKILSGQKPVKDYEFTFELVPEKNYEGKVKNDAIALTTDSITVKHTGSGEVTFPTLTFTQAGIYEFTIKEVKPTPLPAGYTFDEREWTLKVEVTDNDSILKINAEYEIDSSVAGKDETNSETAYFRNEYVPIPITYAPEVQKEFAGDPIPEKKKTFTFSIENAGDNDGAELPTKKTTFITGNASVNTTKFADIKFTKAGTYSFTITEKQETYAGYTFDKSTWDLEVVVVDHDGTLEVESHTYKKNGDDSGDTENSEKAIFVNTYTLKPTIYEAKAVKVLTGETPLTKITYTFNLASTADYSGMVDKFDGLPLEATDIITAERIGAGEVSFPVLTFKQAGTYTFTIKEQKPDPVPEGYTFDERTWTLTVVVKDNESQLEIADTDVIYKASSSDTSDPSPNDGKAYFHNDYEPKPVDKDIVIVKEIKGDVTPVDKTFSFDITAAAGNNNGGADLENKKTVTITGEGETSQKITFKKAGTYKFTVAETEGSDKGYTYDRTQWTVMVKVSDKGGHLAVDSITYRQDGAVSDSADDRAVFTNEYHVTPATFTPDITKTLTIENDNPAKPEIFTFILEASADNDDPGASLAPGGQKTITITLPDNSATRAGKQVVGEKSFDDITFTKAGTYRFQITEVNNNKPDSATAGFTYDGHVWTIEVTVTDVDSELKVETKYTKWESKGEEVISETAAKVDFENNYRANPVGYYPQVEKRLTGSRVTNAPETFNFKIEYLGVNGAGKAASEDGVTLPANMTASVAGSGKTNFEQIKFTKPGDYKFRITEIAGSTLGYTYDDSSWILTVTVTNVNGYLKETHSYQKEDAAGSGEDTNPENAVFENNYEVKTVSYEIPVQKILEGTVPEGYEQKFHFELKLKAADPEDGVVLPVNTSLEIDYIDESARNKKFEAVTFKEAGTYTFEIREVNDGKNGYTYSGDVYTVQIEVKDENSQLTLPTSITYQAGSRTESAAVFSNNYHPLPTEYAPAVTKKIDGTPVNDHEFMFTLEAASENPTVGYRLPSDVELTLKTLAGENPTVSGDFQEIQFTEEGTYNFIIKETQQTEDTTYKYDDSEWTLTVVVTDIGGQLEATASYSKAGEPAEGTGTVADTAEFENIYTPQKVTFAPKAAKEIIGAEPSSDSIFSFALSEQSGNPAGGAELPSPATASVTGEGMAEFGNITFAKAGTYHFTIQEVNGGVKGYKYDDAPWTLTVVVTDTDAVLSVESVSYTRGDDSSMNRALFTNEYSVTPITFTAEVEKQVTGDVPEGEDKNFYFGISTTADSDSVEMPADSRIQITGQGKASFEPITFKVKGEYIFEIREMNTEFTPENQDHGYGYDGTVWMLKVTVSDAGGALQIESATYQLKDGTTGTLALFGNSYTPDAVKYQPVVSDTITGAETPDEKAFTFTLTAASGNPAGAELPDPAAASASVGTKELQAHSAVGRFGDITFNKAGTYSFEIRQDNDGTPGYTYDEHVWTVTVEVVDIDGVLTVQSVTYTRDDGVTDISAAFENAYAVTETTAVLNVTKQLVVDASSVLPNTDETFEFELSVTANPKNGAIVPDNKVITITPDSAHLQGTASYDAITFTKAGTYRFQITEKNHHLAGYTYSGRIWNVTVVVTDEASVLTADITYRDRRGDTSKDTATFVNRFEADPVGYTPWARKVVEGAEMPENHEAEFTFAIEKIEGADTGVIMPDSRTASVTGVGRADFEEITFDQAGTYKFRITEETGEAHGYDYDAAAWILTVEVTNVDGKLKVAPVYEPETGTAESSTVEATFTNHYSVISTRLVPRVTKTVTGNPVPEGMEKTFTFSLKPTGLEPADGCAANKQPLTLDTVLSTNRTGGGKADFPAVTFTKAGTYTFEIWENVPTAVPTGYTYDTTVWTLTVEVVDDDHRLRAYAAYQSPLVNKSSSADFVNRYVPDAASFVPAVEKTIEGDYVGEKPFTFKIEPEGSTDGVIWPADYQDTVIINGENTGTFGEIGFTKAGEYTFNITEDKGRTKGYSYDESVWTLTVTVTDTDGVLTASGVYEQTKNGIADETVTAPEKNADAAKFVNIYKTEEVRYAPVVAKKVTGDSRPPKPEPFRFTIEAAADNPEGAAITDKELAITTDSLAYEASGTIRSFKEIAFTKAGTYRFTIRETKEMAAGYTYDGKTWTVEIEVEDRDSVLTVIRHTYTCEDGTSNDNRAVFTNEYTVKETQYTAKVSKTVEGNPPVDNTFNFYLRPYEDNPEGAVLNSAGELDTTVTGSGTSLFDAIAFTKAGTYRFMIGEETGEAQGYDYAGDIWTLTVTVEDQNSQLVVVKTEYSHDGTAADEAAFTNVYQAIPRTYVPHVHNIVTGHDRPKGQEFDFTITPDEDYGGRVVMPADGGDTVHITDTGWAEFGGITFTQHGTYTFTITEEVPAELPTGYAYEQHREWTLMVEVTDTDAVLGLKVTYSCKTCQDQGEETGHLMNRREAVFINDYVPLDTQYAPTVSKTVDGETPEDKTFTFALNKLDEYADEVQMPDVTTVQVTGSGDAEFDPVIFKKAGVYQFEIREKDDGLTGYYYDINVWILTVTVEDIDGKLQVTGKDYVMAGSEDVSETAAFINIYRPLSVGYTPKLENTVVGDTPEVPEVFTFYITPDESCILDVIWPDDMMIDITGPGTGEFGEFRFTKPGVYTMQLEELIGTAEGYTYDESVWILTVTVTDVDGQLEAEAVYTKENVRAGGEDHALFVNTYKKPEEPTVTENPGTQGTTAAPSQDAAKDADVVTEDSDVSDTSKNQSAKTGDEMKLALWMLLAGISAAGAGVIYRRKKKKQ